jgi:hypothetical protein
MPAGKTAQKPTNCNENYSLIIDINQLKFPNFGFFIITQFVELVAFDSEGALCCV